MRGMHFSFSYKDSTFLLVLFVSISVLSLYCLIVIVSLSMTFALQKLTYAKTTIVKLSQDENESRNQDMACRKKAVSSVS